MRSIGWVCVITLTGAGSWPAQAGTALATMEEVDIRIDRPERVGQRSCLTASGSLTTIVRIGDEPESRSECIFQIEAIREVLEVGQDGRATKVALTVQTSSAECEKLREKVELAAPGSTVVYPTEKGKFAARAKDPNRPLSITEKMLWSFVIGAIGTDVTLGLSDVGFGNNEPKRVGESWQVNREMLAKTLGRVPGLECIANKDGIAGVTLHPSATDGTGSGGSWPVVR